MTKPDGAQLLMTARADLLKVLLPSLPEDYHYDALMIANAMKIAALEIEKGAENEARTLQLLERASASGEETSQSEQETELAHSIRSGKFDASADYQPLLQTLLQITHNKLEISNPKLIRQRIQ